MSYSHFEGKNPLEHVVEARKKGRLASKEAHGEEVANSFSAFLDSIKETSLLLGIFFLLFPQGGFFLAFSLGWLLWKTGRYALFGFSRLERLHRVLEEERFEIEHHREQEKEELKALYQAKGFKGKLLDEAVEVLMADDNRLLQVMLEEELGLNLECYEHPLKQASGAFLGVLVSFSVSSIAYFFLPNYTIFPTLFSLIAIASFWMAKKEKNRPLPSLIWNIALASVSFLSAYFFSEWTVR